MIKQTLYFGNPTYLRLRNKQLEIKTSISGLQNETKRSIEVIGFVILDHPQIISWYKSRTSTAKGITTRIALITSILKDDIKH